MDNFTSQQLMDELQKRLYAIPVEKLREYCDMFEIEYLNRMAANSGYEAFCMSEGNVAFVDSDGIAF